MGLSHHHRVLRGYIEKRCKFERRKAFTSIAIRGSPGHKYKVKQIFYIEVKLNEEEYTQDEEHEHEEPDQEEAKGDDPYISIHALVGVARPRTIKT